MPAVDTFENIRESLGAATVSLPSRTDLEPSTTTPQQSPKSRMRKRLVASGPQKKIQSFSRTSRSKSWRSGGFEEKRGGSQKPIPHKAWNPIFFSCHTFRDRRHIEIWPDKDGFYNLLEEYLCYSDSPGRSWVSEQVRKFLRRQHTNLSTKLWINDRTERSATNPTGWLTSSELEAAFRSEHRFVPGLQGTKDASETRRLV
jgi:hypothetical protein